MTAQLKTVREASQKLSWAFDSAWTNHMEELIRICADEERGHRNSGPDFSAFHPGAASIKDCARMFAVKRIAEYLQGATMPKGKDYLHFQKSAFYAAAMVDEFRADLEKALSGFSVPELAQLDYCDFVKVKTPKAA